MDKRTFAVAMLGVIVQYYDHHLFGFLAAKISKYLIPASDPTVQLLNTYFIMAMAVLAKPIGALTLGRIGDLYGRSTTLTLSLIGTSLASFVISLTPGYGNVGVISAVILLMCRMCTSALVSSGTDGVRLFIYEHIGRERQCFGNGLVISSTMLGSFMASVSAWVFTLDLMPSYAWRACFAIGGVMGFSVVFIRRRYPSACQNNTLQTDHSDIQFRDSSILELVSKHSMLFIICTCVAGSIGSANQFYIIFFGTYSFDVLHNITQSTMQFYTSASIVLYMLCSAAGGILADYYGRKRVHFIAFTVLFTMNIFMAHSFYANRVNYWIFFLSNAALPFLNVTALAFLKQSIPKAIRYRIFSLAHALGSICISTPTAFISTLLYHKTKISWLPMIYFLSTITIIAAGTCILCKKYNADEY